MIKSIEEQIDAIFEEYGRLCDDAIMDASKNVAGDCVKKLKAVKFDTNVRGYSKSWARKKLKNGYVVYNKDHYQLTHLLEYGHAVMNQFGAPRNPGAKRRVEGIKHIQPVEEWGNKKFVDNIIKELKL